MQGLFATELVTRDDTEEKPDHYMMVDRIVVFISEIRALSITAQETPYLLYCFSPAAWDQNEAGEVIE